jgi:acetoin utilization deacetylase AcuC-like enzyme
MSNTGFFWDERCFWHAGGNFAMTMPLGGNVQPLAAGGLPENPETKRRLKNLMDVTGLLDAVAAQSAPPATFEDLNRIHPADFLQKFKDLSDADGGTLGLRTPFTNGGYEMAAQSAGLAKAALAAVLKGELKNAYSLSRPPGHHCLPDYPMGFCLLANIPIAIEAAKAAGLGQRFAVLDWDVHHGNGTEAIFYGRDDVLTISIHQDHNFPLDKGDAADRGDGVGNGFNINLPLPPGCGDVTYLDMVERVAVPAIRNFKPDAIIIACGFDAGPFDPLAQMMVSAAGFRAMTRAVMRLADEVCGGKLVMVHEGGYSEAYVPFCGHAVIAEMAGSTIDAGDPLGEAVHLRQPKARAVAFQKTYVDEYVTLFGLG